MKKNKTMIVCFLTPACIFFAAIFLYPICRTVIMSFFKVEAVSDPVSLWEFVGLSNFTALAGSSVFRVAMMNMMKIWLLGGVIVLGIAMLFAAILTSGIMGKESYRAIIYIPNIINAVAMSTMWISYVFNKRFGLFHSFFNAIGANQLAGTDYMNGSIKFYSLLAAFSFGSVGYFMLIFMSGIEQLSEDVFEAASIDGANKIRQYFYITLPLLKGVFKTCITFWTVSIVGFFVWSQMWSAPLSSELPTITPFVYMYNVTFGTMGTAQRDGGLGAAVGVVMASVVLVVFFIMNRVVRDDGQER